MKNLPAPRLRPAVGLSLIFLAASGCSGPTSFDPFVEPLKQLESPEVEVRRKAVRKLNEFEMFVDEALTALLKAAISDDDEEVRELAVWSLIKCDDESCKEVFEKLEQATRTEQSDDVRGAMYETMRLIKRRIKKLPPP